MWIIDHTNHTDHTDHTQRLYGEGGRPAYYMSILNGAQKEIHGIRTRCCQLIMNSLLIVYVIIATQTPLPPAVARCHPIQPSRATFTCRLCTRPGQRWEIFDTMSSDSK